MTGPELATLTAFRDEVREELGAMRADISSVKNEMAEWRGAIRLIRAMAGVLGFSGIAILLRVLVTS